MNPIQIAEFAIQLGFVPIPLRGKTPVRGEWQKTTMKNAMTFVKRYVHNGRADNVGIVCGGVSGVVVVDIDIKNGGRDTWNSFIAKYGPIDTFTVVTGSGGYHFYFKYDERTSQLRNSSWRSKGVDLKTTDGQVVFVGSVHPETKDTYKLAMLPDSIPAIARMPDWLFQIFITGQSSVEFTS